MLLFDGGYAKAERTSPTSATYGYTLFYYTQDHLGNNREVISASGVLKQKTSYYPFGGIIANISSSQDIQPYKYNGKELDLMHGLNTYDYGARQYNSVTARWDRMDPLCEKYYSLSPYNYCGGNPVRFVDIHGDSLTIQGNRQQRIEMLGYLQQLTNDKLGVNQNGTVVILKNGTRNINKKLNIGTSLISSIISSEHNMDIKFGDENKEHRVYRLDGWNGKGTDVRISFNPRENPVVLTCDIKTGRSIMETILPKIVLGHELVHGYRSMCGNGAHPDAESSYIFKDIDEKMYRERKSTEELETVGITGNSLFTENKLRREHGLNPRIRY